MEPFQASGSGQAIEVREPSFMRCRVLDIEGDGRVLSSSRPCCHKKRQRRKRCCWRCRYTMKFEGPLRKKLKDGHMRQGRHFRSTAGACPRCPRMKVRGGLSRLKPSRTSIGSWARYLSGRGQVSLRKTASGITPSGSSSKDWGPCKATT